MSTLGSPEARFRGPWSPSIADPTPSVGAALRERERMLTERRRFLEAREADRERERAQEQWALSIAGEQAATDGGDGDVEEQQQSFICVVEHEPATLPATPPRQSRAPSLAHPPPQHARPGEKEMWASYQVAGYALRQRLHTVLPSFSDMLYSLNPHRILSVHGQYDHAHSVLEASHVPFTSVTQQRFLAMDLSDVVIVYLNCGPCAEQAAMACKLRAYVKAGGHLVSTDWGIRVLAAAFPGTISPASQQTGDEVIPITHVRDDDWILGGIFANDADGAPPQWWIEDRSYPIMVVDVESRVQVLAFSAPLQKRYGHGAVIVRFAHGDGLVYHMLSHFYLQRSLYQAKHARNAYSFLRDRGMQSSSTLERLCRALDYDHMFSAYSSSFVLLQTIIEAETCQWMRRQADAPPVLQDGQWGAESAPSLQDGQWGVERAAPAPSPLVEGLWGVDVYY